MAPLGPFGTAPRLAAGVSGGPHSLALALLAAEWARGQGGDLLAIVVDHGLRPESAEEAAGVAALLAGRGIPAQLRRLALAPGAAMQERARQGRMAALLAACRAEGRPWLLLGHHLLDQAETLLFRALRGSGPEGLAAMLPVRVTAEALILRPLLGLPPARLEATLAAAGLTPVRDPSNDNPRFARIRLRRALADPGGEGRATAALAEAAAAFATRRARREAALAARLAHACALRPEGFAEIDPAALGADAVAEAALARLVQLVAGAAFPPPAEAVRALRRRGAGTLAGAWLQPGPGGIWRLLREPSAVAPPVPASPGALWDGRFRLSGKGGENHWIGALGPPPPALRRAAPGLPAAILSSMPAVWYNAMLVAVPPLLYPDRTACVPFALDFAPAAGAATGQAVLGRETEP